LDFYSKEKEKKTKPEKKIGDHNVYIVLNKNTEAVIGVYSSIEKAKIKGNKATYHSCSIIEFKIDGDCRFLNSPIYES